MNVFKRAIVRWRFRMAKRLIESVDKAMSENKTIGRADRRRFWRDFAKSPEARKGVIKELETRIKAL